MEIRKDEIMKIVKNAKNATIGDNKSSVIASLPELINQVNNHKTTVQ